MRQSAAHFEQAEETVLVERYVPLARKIARRVSWRFSNQDYDDLYSDALLGLLSAARRWDPDRATFAAFARPWIEGQILKGIQHRTGVRSDRRKQPPPTVSLDAFEALSQLPDRRVIGPEQALARSELWAAVSALDLRSNLIVRLYYQWGLPQSVIARLVGCSQMHISRLLSAAYDALEAA